MRGCVQKATLSPDDWQLDQTIHITITAIAAAAAAASATASPVSAAKSPAETVMTTLVVRIARTTGRAGRDRFNLPCGCRLRAT